LAQSTILATASSIGIAQNERELHVDIMNYINRSLWFHSALGRGVAKEAELLSMSMPLVILGEPGMGKSELLRNLSDSGNARLVTARQLINRTDPRSLIEDGDTILIDALDEVPATGVGDAVDLVLQRLGQLSYPRFILSCRAADWRSAMSVAAINEQYADGPLELHLEQLTQDAL
jgi:hypothetical protein